MSQVPVSDWVLSGVVNTWRDKGHFLSVQLFLGGVDLAYIYSFVKLIVFLHYCGPEEAAVR